MANYIASFINPIESVKTYCLKPCIMHRADTSLIFNYIGIRIAATFILHGIRDPGQISVNIQKGSPSVFVF